MNAPMLSVVVPMYNVEQYLDKCLQSIQEQTYTNFEVLCIDDVSPDNCAQIAEGYAKRDSRFRVIRHTQNKRPGGARNTGIENARGKYISFIDSDDWLLPNKFESEFVALERTGLNCVWSRFYTAMYEEDELILSDSLEDIREGEFRVTQDNFLLHPVMPWNKMYRLSAIKQYKLSFIENTLHDDTLFFVEFVIVSPLVYVLQTPLYVYRQRDESIMGKYRAGDAQLEDFIIEYEHYRKYLIDNRLWENNHEFFYKFIEAISSGMLIDQKFRKPLWKLLKTYLKNFDNAESLPPLLAYIRDAKPYGPLGKALLRVAFILNKFNPIPTLRRRWREYLRIQIILN